MLRCQNFKYFNEEMVLAIEYILKQYYYGKILVFDEKFLQCLEIFKETQVSYYANHSNINNINF